MDEETTDQTEQSGSSQNIDQLESESGLDPKGKTLMRLLPTALSLWEPAINCSLDEVVVTVEPKHLLEVAHLLRNKQDLSFDRLRCLSIVDYEGYFQVVYHIWSRLYRHKAVLKTNVVGEELLVASVTSIWKDANWFEREGHELFGINFDNHPDLRPLLLWEDFEGFPGRKSYPFPEYEEF